MLFDLIRVPDPNCIDDLLDEPLGLLYLAAVIREQGMDVRITNLAGHDRTSWQKEIKPADVYGIQLYTPTAALGCEIATFIKKTFPGKPVIGGGAHPTAVPEHPDLKIFDTLVCGEGETAMPQIISALKLGNDLPPRIQTEFIQELDKLPFPARDLIDMNAFHRKVDGDRCFGIIGSRGCCFKCAFCDQSLFGSRVRYRSLDNIIDEIKQIQAVYGVQHLEFFDDMWTLHKKRLQEFTQKTNGMGLNYRCNGRTDVLDEEVYRLLKASGCSMICFGIESGSQKMLDLMNKGTTVEKAYQAVALAQKAGLIAAGYFILGFPGETVETIQATREFIEKSDIDQAQCYTFVPLPGTDIYRNPDKYGITQMSQNFSDYYLVMGNEGLGGRTIETKYLTSEELENQVKIFRTFLRERPSRGKLQDYYTEKLKYRS